MASEYSGLKFELITTGEQAGTWGATTNTNLGVAIQEAITGSVTIDFLGNSTKTLTLTNTNATQEARNLRLNLVDTGGGSGNRTLYLSSGCQIDKLYIINNTLVGETITVRNYIGGSPSGASIVVPAERSKFVFNTGTDIVEAANATSTVDLTADVTGILPAANGGTGNAYFLVSGPTTSTKTYTFPDASTSIAGLTTTQTLTNKRVTPRVTSISTGTTITPDSDSYDQYNVTALGTAAVISTPSGSPTNGQKLIIRLRDNGTSRALTWSGAYRPIGTLLPTTTIATKTIYVGCVYNTEAGFWDAVAVAEEA